ncbi:hypothetical protein [Streptomyces sp. NPDC056690]|uniref:hypothetical protein n=1 Tax=Streptomyces sp. NPDC056690 TaxID=3345912 RepID=UPI003695CBC3
MADETPTTGDAPATGTGAIDPTFTPPTATPAEQPPPGDEPLGEGGKRALAAEREARRDLERRLKEVEPLAAKYREIEDSQKSDLERLTEQLTAAEQRAQQAESDGLRMQVAAAKGLTPEQAARLQGATREELEADADQLRALFTPPEQSTSERPPQRTPVEMLRPGAIPDSDGAAADMNAWMRRKPPTTN